MFSDSLQRNGFLNYSCYAICLLLLWGSNLFWGQDWNIPVIVYEHQMPLQQLVVLLYADNNYIFAALCSLIVCAVTGILLSRINYVNLFLSGKRDYLLPFLFVTLSSVFYTGREMLHVYLAVFLCVLAYWYLFNTYRQNRPYGDIFIAAFCIALASLLYASAIIFLIPLFIGIGIMKGFDWRDWIIALVGIITPYAYTELYYVLLGQEWFYLFDLIKECLLDSLPEHLFFTSYSAYVFMGFSIILEILAIPIITARLRRMKIKAMRINIIVLITYVVSIVAFVSIISTGREFVILIAFPASLLITNLFNYIKKPVISNLLMTVFVFLLVLAQFFPE